jgi:uncharacterized protein (DUF2235 family)
MKKIIICSDGTWNKKEDGSEKNTNVARLCAELDVSTSSGQKVFYDSGVGSDSLFLKLVAGATGFGISKNIKDCYKYLVENYAPGDQIFLFGFSRGAYTVRSLAGFIYRCGILKKDNIAQIDKAYDCYHNNDEKSQAAFKSNSVVGNVHMIGVWDTVGALGIPVNALNNVNPLFHKFHDTRLNDTVKFGYHALSIDESRKNFSPTLWDEPAAKGQVIEQVWFAGVHSDVGGGYPEHELSDITLEWMIAKALAHGIKFKPGYEHLAKPDSHGFMHDPRAGMGKIYREQLRKISANRQAKLYSSVPERAGSNQNKPTAEYKPKNLVGLADLSTVYTIMDKMSIPPTV